MGETSGVWIDTRTMRVVRDEPEEGRLVAAPGEELTAAHLAVIEAFDAPEDAAAPKARGRKAAAPKADG